MASTSFIADHLDITASIERVRSEIDVVFIENRHWDSEKLHASSDLSEFGDKLMLIGGRQFFVIPASMPIQVEKVSSYLVDKPYWQFNYQCTTGWLQLELGGWVEDQTLWIPGSIGSNNRTEKEKSLFANFKKLWLKGYKKGPHNYRYGPSALNSLATVKLASYYE
jgi:hypothetical protein